MLVHIFVVTYLKLHGIAKIEIFEVNIAATKLVLVVLLDGCALLAEKVANHGYERQTCGAR